MTFLHSTRCCHKAKFLSPGDWSSLLHSQLAELHRGTPGNLNWAFHRKASNMNIWDLHWWLIAHSKCRVWPLKPSVLTLGIVLLPTALHWICYQQKHSGCSSLGTEREVCNEGLEMLEHAPISLPVTLIVCHQPSHLKSSLVPAPSEAEE